MSRRVESWAVLAWTLVLIVVGGQAALALSGISIGINPTASQPYRVFIVLHGRPFGRGDLVAFRFGGSRYYPAGTIFVKEVKGLAGDRLEIRQDRTVRLNEAAMDAVRATDSKGRAVEPFLFEGTIPSDRHFLYSDAPNSYDSRYYGLIAKSQIIGRAVPLL
ncbi:MAG: signal peptidase I [Nitrospirota bacterium]